MYEYKCKIRKVVDGDTVDIDIDLGFGIWLNDERVRIIGIDTPESRTSDDVEKIFGMAAKERVQRLLGADSTLISKVKGDGNEEMRGKFGRILGDFRLGDGDTLTSTMYNFSGLPFTQFKDIEICLIETKINIDILFRYSLT